MEESRMNYYLPPSCVARIKGFQNQCIRVIGNSSTYTSLQRLHFDTRQPTMHQTQKAPKYMAWKLDDACAACSELARKLRTQRVSTFPKNQSGQRSQGANLLFADPLINCSTKSYCC